MRTNRSTQHHATMRRLRNVDHTVYRRDLSEPAPNDQPKRYGELLRLKIAVRDLLGAATDQSEGSLT